MSIDIYNSGVSLTVSASDHDKGCSGRLYIRNYHFDKLADCAIGIGLCGPKTNGEGHMHVSFHREKGQAFYLHMYVPKNRFDQEGVCIAMLANQVNVDIRLSWNEFKTLLDAMRRDAQ